MVLYVLEGGFKVGADALKAGDVLWLGAHTDRPAIAPADTKPLKLLEIRAHGAGTGQKVIHAADVKSYKIAGGKATAKLLLDGTGAKLAVDEIDAEAGAAIAAHKHQAQDEVLFFVAGRTDDHRRQAGVSDGARATPCTFRRTPMHSMKVTEPMRAIQIYAPGGPSSGSRRKNDPRLRRDRVGKDPAPDRARLRAQGDRAARAQVGRGGAFPSELIPKLAELGLLGMKVPEELGGAGMSTQEVAIVIEELARVDGSVALTVAVAQRSVHRPHPARRQRRAEAEVPAAPGDGQGLGAWGLTEPSSGSDAAGAKTRAVKQGDKWILNGIEDLHHAGLGRVRST